MELDLELEGGWPAGAWEALTERVALAAGTIAPELANPRLVVSLLFTSDAEVQALNREWRGKDRPTNVLSFPMLARAELLALAEAGPPELIGDIALAAGICAREAEARDVALTDHVAHLLVHGLLHLAGYDHEPSDADACVMEALETKVLALLLIADPYGDSNETMGN